MSIIEEFYNAQDERSRIAIDQSIEAIVKVKEKGGKIAVVTGSGPNIHEGVTTLIAELINKGLIDGITTSSAVVGHEMAGALDKVWAVNATDLGFDEKFIPRGNVFEITKMSQEEINKLKEEIIIDETLIDKGLQLPGREIMKAAGNMAYPMGLRGEILALEILELCKLNGLPFEYIAGLGADPMTMIGAGVKNNVPVLVSVPQLVGSGNVGLAIADSISMFERCRKVADIMERADIIIESAVALTQEIHDGPFETYTGHGIWSYFRGHHTYSLRGKTLIRIDLDENLRKATTLQKEMQEAIDKGLPKTKASGIPFRMEMSAFARHEGSIPIIGDIGRVWPVIATRVALRLGIKLDFMSYTQDIPEGKAMREWIVANVKPLDKKKMITELEKRLN
jgi:deoxyhypusine synthase